MEFLPAGKAATVFLVTALAVVCANHATAASGQHPREVSLGELAESSCPSIHDGDACVYPPAIGVAVTQEETNKERRPTWENVYALTHPLRATAHRALTVGVWQSAGSAPRAPPYLQKCDGTLCLGNPGDLL
ncbi:hypothetical protein HPB50_026504 [Hyalomma asiaticum]|uniref:Uncharacterized protein n=1 Tax=Hyalomma asiaticum TaxID=266040 RepID=A0ACB7SU67_HYAAI|nr:hypothetical protein HPB50_026504 [Hyalomma asiaticum]